MPSSGTPSGTPVGDRLRAHNLGAVHLLHLEAEMHHLKGRRREADPFYQFILPTQGRVQIAQHPRRTVIEAGHLAVLDTTQPFEVRFDERAALVVVGAPQELVGIPSVLMQQMIATDIGSDAAGHMIGIVLPMLLRLTDGLIAFSSYTPGRLAHNLMDLFTTVLFEHLAAVSPTGSVQQSILEIITFIDAHLHDPELSAETIAAAHYISPRHLRKLFESQQIKVSDWIRARRLESCRRDLVDPTLASLPISAIAMRWGFLDPAHFSRLFKATFGQSPSHLRRQGLEPDPTLS